MLRTSPEFSTPLVAKTGAVFWNLDQEKKKKSQHFLIVLNPKDKSTCFYK